MSSRFFREHWKILAIFASISAVLSYGYLNIVGLSCVDARIAHHQAILAHTADAPFRYRVLVPFLVEILIQTLATLISYKKAFVLSYAVYEFAAIFLILATLFVYLKEWFSKEQSLIGVLFVAGTMTVALRDHCYQPWSLLEASFYTLALWCCYRKWYGWFGLVVVLSALTKESTVFILLIFLFTAIRKPISKRNLLLFCFYCFCWFSIFVFLRYFFGMDIDPTHLLGYFGFKLDLTYGWVHNTDPLNLKLALLHIGLIFGIFWVFAVLGFKKAPHPFLKRVLFVLPFYLVVWSRMGLWWEVRLLMLFYPFIIPLGLSYLYRRE